MLQRDGFRWQQQLWLTTTLSGGTSMTACMLHKLSQKASSSSLDNKIQGFYEAKSSLKILDYVNSDWRIVAPKHCAHDHGSTQYFLFTSSGMKFSPGAQHIYLHVSRWQEEIWTSCFPLYKYLFSEKKSKRCERNT